MDRIDLQLLKLLQQRTDLSRRIGETKRQHGAVVYVPGRERDVLRRVDELSRGKIPSRSVVAIYREILSSSRAAQGQGAIGLLRDSSSAVLLPARWSFGASGDFRPLKSWRELAAGLTSGDFAFALLTGADLARVLGSPAARRNFAQDFRVVRDFPPKLAEKCRMEERIYVITLREVPIDPASNRMLILIECKSKGDTVKSWLNSMPELSIDADRQIISQRGESTSLLVRLSSVQPVQADRIEIMLRETHRPFSLLGIYGGSEDYAG